MILPTIGRVVLIHRPWVKTSQWEAGIVQYVSSDTQVTVSGVDRQGLTFVCDLRLDQSDIARDPVKKLADDSAVWQEPFACWMPYQRQVQGR